MRKGIQVQSILDHDWMNAIKARGVVQKTVSFAQLGQIIRDTSSSIRLNYLCCEEPRHPSESTFRRIQKLGAGFRTLSRVSR